MIVSSDLSVCFLLLIPQYKILQVEGNIQIPDWKILYIYGNRFVDVARILEGPQIGWIFNKCILKEICQLKLRLV